jgi:hypothetical protein
LIATDPVRSLSDRLNQECFCITVDHARLREELQQGMGDGRLTAAFIEARPHLFSNTPVFLSANEIAAMLRVVHAIEAAVALPAYREAVLAWAPEIAHHEFGPRGVFMGYDFHLTADGPKLIEVNTNAGGAFLNAVLLRAQRACCTEVDVALGRSGADEFESAVMTMFQNEWKLQRKLGSPRRIAIVDDQPEQQYLYAEFLVAQGFFARHGVEAHITDPRELRFQGDALLLNGQPVELVYNRLVDFSLEQPEHAALRAAYLSDAAVVTPNPRVHALFADKRNMTVLSDRRALETFGLPPDVLDALGGVPRTMLVTASNAAQLWSARKDLFFKPASGHGSRAVYRGDKVTKRVWEEITRGGYVAQEHAAPSERVIRIDGAEHARKADVRLYVYDGKLLLSAARLYQGQTTNFRTPGGGFAPLLAL